MTSPQLPHYVRTHRKRLGLSQREIAFLLGVTDGGKVSRYESFTRKPSIETLLACEAIFDKPAREIFAGMYEEARKKVAARAKVLSYRTDKSDSKRLFFTTLANKRT